MNNQSEDDKVYFNNLYRNRTVLVFGHTGFKGSWLTIWLAELGARVIGASLNVPTQPSHFESASVSDLVDSRTIDIRDRHAVLRLLKEIQPDYVFHLAAQALVKRSYRQPIETFQTNTMGTANIVDALREIAKPCVAVLITSDKCYENVETYYGYRETDRLGGKDPYSASKAAAEMIIRSFLHSFFEVATSPMRIGVTRAGNVIGGGDWAEDRLIPDIIRSWQKGEPVTIRSPNATRPWQHVLEPLSGYLLLGAELSHRPDLHGEAFNFGPKPEDVYAVGKVTQLLSERLQALDVEYASDLDQSGHYEAGLLKLSCDKALHLLGWQPVLSFDEAVALTSDWYRTYYQQEGRDTLELTRTQILQYCDLSRKRKYTWITCM